MADINANKPGFKQTKIGWIPQEWKLNSMKEFGTFFKGKGISKSEIQDQGFPAVRYGELYTTYDTIIVNCKSYINKSSAEKSNQAKKGDLLFPGSGETPEEIGKPSLLDVEKAWISGDIISFRQVSNNPYFLAYFLNSQIAIKERARVAQGVSVVHIYSRDLKELKIPLPPLPEQRRIATILSTWDKAIEKLDHLIEKKRELKKGLMQQLLTGQLRFPEFVPEGGTNYKETKLGRIPEEWEVVNLGEAMDLLTDFEANGSFADVKKNVSVYEEPNYAWYVRATDIENKTPLAAVKYVDEHSYLFLKKTSLSGGEVVVTKRGEIGKVYQIPELELPATLGPNLYLLKLKADRIKSKFLFYFLKSYVGYKALVRINSSTTLGALYKDDVKKLKIPLPTLEEQLTINKILLQCDEEIEKLEHEKNQLQLQKKGLMQQLLTGAIRVKT